MFHFTFLCSLLFLAAPLRSASLTLESAVTRALRHNPDLAAARFSIEEARGRLLQAGRLPNPELESELMPNVRGSGEMVLSVGFMQRYPLTNRLRLERAVSEAGVRAAEAEVANAGRLLAAEIRAAAVEMLALQAQKRLKESQRQNSSALADAAAKAAQTGEGSPLEAAQFSLEAKQLELDLLQTDAAITAAAGRLRPLLGLPAGEPLMLTGELASPFTMAPRADLTARADYRAALERESAAQTAVEAARAGKWEDVEVGLTAELEREDDAPAGLESEGFIGFRVSVPLPLWNRNEGKVHEATATAARAAAERDALALRIRAEAAAAHAEMAAAARILEASSGPLLTKAKELEESFRKAKEAGGATPADVFRAREKRLALEALQLNALRDWHLARVRLLAAQGR